MTPWHEIIAKLQCSSGVWISANPVGVWKRFRGWYGWAGVGAVATEALMVPLGHFGPLRGMR